MFPNRKFLAIFLSVSIVMALFLAPMQAFAKPDPTATVTLTVNQAAFTAAESVLVQVTISNPNKHAIKVLKWATPVGEVEDPLFAISQDGAAVSYMGAIYKRPAPTGQDYITLSPGESVTGVVDLGMYYDLSITGAYAIRYDAAFANMYTESARGGNIAQLVSNEVTVIIEGRATPIPADAFSIDAVTGTTSFNKCTAAQQTDLLAARGHASTYSANALSYLNGNNQGSRYTTWFGTYNSSRYNTVKSHFSAISGAMDTAPVTFDCGCKKPYYAYVYSNQPYKIFLCKVFWNTAPMTGTDSKAGTLIHEMSHFNVVASTDDWAYGQTNAKSLAISDPTRAVDNADSHEYFAENTPALP